ncbi:hypothetical protein EVAR_88746_1 [Eumeta japonica]|uniref:Tip elongation aberrant protein 1 n=1 Tax=Eumeta variegata TaxID=151549 RepID=A0A4C1XTT2_EUMVA|nr:hypothetical protein EVAR_88746_1 [Eumeta japonica]
MWTAVRSGGGVGDDGGEGAAPCTRAKHSATLVGGHVYVLGGRGAAGALPLKDLWRYGLSSGRWERVTACGAAPPALQEHSAVARGRRLYVFGGEAGAHPTETPLWVLDTDDLVWRKLPGEPPPLPARAPGPAPPGAEGPRGRRGHSAHALADCMLVYGGYKDFRGSTDEIWAFHYESEAWQRVRAAGAGPARHRHAAALHDGRLYVHGGMCDLRDCADLWVYDTRTRRWRQARTPAKLSPSARSGHACVRAGAHLYIFGGECEGRLTDELWRFHFVMRSARQTTRIVYEHLMIGLVSRVDTRSANREGSETWEQLTHQRQWPAARVDACALLVSEPGLVARARSAPVDGRACPTPPAGLLHEITKLSQFHLRRAARCSYTVLAAERDSTESLVGGAPPSPTALGKSRSAYAIDERRPPDGVPAPRVADEAEQAGIAAVTVTRIDVAPRRWRDMPKSASVRFSANVEDDWSTSEYSSAEWVERAALAFSNPHYEGGAPRQPRGTLTPDSGVAMAPADIELRELKPRPTTSPPALHMLLVGGKEVPHAALLSRPLTLWAYRLL